MVSARCGHPPGCDTSLPRIPGEVGPPARRQEGCGARTRRRSLHQTPTRKEEAAGEVSGDEGYFKERLAAARRQVAGAWTERAACLTPAFPRTDILGGLLVAGELFQETPHAKNILVSFSDMREPTPAPALENRQGI